MGNNSATTQSLPGNLLGFSPAPAKAGAIRGVESGVERTNFSDTFSNLRSDATRAKPQAQAKPIAAQSPASGAASAPHHHGVKEHQRAQATPDSNKESGVIASAHKPEELNKPDHVEASPTGESQGDPAVSRERTSEPEIDGEIFDVHLAEQSAGLSVGAGEGDLSAETEGVLTGEENPLDTALASDLLQSDVAAEEELAPLPVAAAAEEGQEGALKETPEEPVALSAVAIESGSRTGAAGSGDGMVASKSGSATRSEGFGPANPLATAIKAENGVAEGELAKPTLAKSGELIPDGLPKDAFTKTLADGFASQLDGKATSTPGQQPMSPTAGLEAITRTVEPLAPAARSFVAQTGVAAQVGQPQWSQAVGERVLWLAAQNLSVAELRLDPPELGPMQVRVTVQQDQVQVNFTSAHASVRDALDQGAARLREMFSEQGLHLNVEVSDQSLARDERDNEKEGGDGKGQPDAEAGTEAVVAETDIRSVRLIDHYA